MWTLGGAKLYMVLSGTLIVGFLGGLYEGRPLACVVYGVCAGVASYVALSLLNGFEARRQKSGAPTERQG